MYRNEYIQTWYSNMLTNVCPLWVKFIWVYIYSIYIYSNIFHSSRAVVVIYMHIMDNKQYGLDGMVEGYVPRLKAVIIGQVVWCLVIYSLLYNAKTFLLIKPVRYISNRNSKTKLSSFISGWLNSGMVIMLVIIRYREVPVLQKS